MIRSKHRFTYESTYFLSKEPDEKVKDLWVVFHGYGQLVEYFLRKFQFLATEERLFLAPEATNYSYLKDFKGRVGANWMTRHERELAIANNHRYLDSLLEGILNSFEQKPRIHVLGFSQGAATATRWASQWKGSLDTLVLWAGGFAEDMALDIARDKFEETTIYSVLGSQDQLITEESLARQKLLIQRLDRRVEQLEFQGGHELDSELLRKIVEKA